LLPGMLQAERINIPVINKQTSLKKVVCISPLG
jgi:hypothetical protein